jgi:hypothetical protein
MLSRSATVVWIKRLDQLAQMKAERVSVHRVGILIRKGTGDSVINRFHVRDRQGGYLLHQFRGDRVGLFHDSLQLTV